MTTEFITSEFSTSERCAELQARCELQRMDLAEQVGDIEQRLQSTDAVLGSIRNVMTKPAVLAGGLVLMAAVGRFRWWSLLSRGMVLAVTARRVIQAFAKR